MKVLTLTTQYANNYGALLQCYALSKYLNNLDGIECQVIQYYHPTADASWKLIYKPSNFRSLLKTIYTSLNVRYLVKRKSKFKVMKAFMFGYLPLTEEKYTTPESIRSNPPLADVYICGSDQIWNMMQMVEGKLIYFLDFAPDNAKKIAYAASIADPWTKDQEAMVAPLLKRFTAISIREKGNLPQVQSLFSKATVVIDPVFLLNRGQWDELRSNKRVIDEPYILCYFLSVTDQMVQTVKKIKKLTGYKIVHLNINALDKFNSDYVIRDADPREFIGLISKASFVCTNSFHCSAFSVIYRRNFTFCPKAHANERIVNLQEVFGLGDVIMTSTRLQNIRKKEDLIVDYSKADCLGSEFIEYSKNFLKDSIYDK